MINRNIILILCIFNIGIIKINCQENQVYILDSILGEVINLNEKTDYGLFEFLSVKAFNEAIIYHFDDTKYEVKIKLNNGFSIDTLLKKEKIEEYKLNIKKINA